MLCTIETLSRIHQEIANIPEGVARVIAECIHDTPRGRHGITAWLVPRQPQRPLVSKCVNRPN